MNLKQDGITLIEVLLILALLSVVGVIIWGVFLQGIKFSSKAVSINNLQQEANIITTSLTNTHQTSSHYKINFDDNDTIIIEGSFRTDNEEGSFRKNTEIFNNPLFNYQLKVETKSQGVENLQNINSGSTIDPNKVDTFIELTVSDKKDTSNKFTVKTVLSRLKSSTEEESGEND